MDGTALSQQGAWRNLRHVLSLVQLAWSRFWPGLLLTTVCISILLAYAAASWSGRERHLDSARDATANLSGTLADHAEATMRIAELTVSDLVDRLERDGTSRGALKTLHRDLAQSVFASGRLQDAMVFSHDGHFLVSARAAFDGNSGLDEALAWHGAHATSAVHVGPLVKDWMAQGWSLLVSRRWNEADGSFGGVAVVTIGVSYFGDYYDSLRLGPAGAVALVSTEGQLLMRTRVGGSVIGQDVSQSSSFRVYAAGGSAGTLVVESPLDGVTRQGNYRAVPHYPMVVFVGLALDDILDGWRRDTVVNGVVVGLLVLCTALLGWRLGQLVRSHRAAAAAAQASERLYRLLAVSGTDVIVQLGADMRRRYVSPACADVLGYAPEVLICRSPQADMHPDDWAVVAATMDQIRGGSEPRSVAFRFRKPDGVFLWVEANVRWKDDTDGFVVSIRDISARVAVQEQLLEANNQLQRLVMLDGLTGISNRRCLDSCLEREFRRASREEIPLSVLMIDADRFKSYNDTYGHGAGDECLRAIAGVLSQSLRRAADLASRFGGEEFVVMLPHTDQAGAMALGEKIRFGIEALAIPQAGAAAGVVTVSIGVATAEPGRNAESAAVLLAAADAALYEAKHGGRNRVVPACPPAPMPAPLQLQLAAQLKA